MGELGQSSHQIQANRLRHPLNLEDKLPWTATRCQRLSRPVLSKLNALRKLRDTRQRGLSAEDSRSWESEDVQRKRPKQQYTSRRTICAGTPQPKVGSLYEASNSILGGEIAIPTPIFRDAYSHGNHHLAKWTVQANETSICTQSQDDCAKASKRQPVSRKRPKYSHNTDGPDPQSFLDSFEAFIKVTAVSKHTRLSHIGMGSLQDLCLKNIASHMNVIIKSLKNEPRQDDIAEDCVNNTYSALEEFVPSYPEGSKHLRLLVREYVVTLVCEALLDSIFDDSTVASLTQLAIEQNAFDIYKSFLTIPGLSTRTFKIIYKQEDYLRAVHGNTKGVSDIVLRIRQHAMFVRLPSTIESTKLLTTAVEPDVFFKLCRTALVAVTTKNGDWQMAARFLQELITVPMDCKLVAAAITNILGILVSIELLRLTSKAFDCKGRDGKSTGAILIQQLSDEFAQQLDRGQTNASYFSRTSTLALCGFLISIFENSKDGDLAGQRKSTLLFSQAVMAFKKRYNPDSPERKTGLLGLKTLVYGVAKHYGKASGSPTEAETPSAAAKLLSNAVADSTSGCLQLILEGMLSAPGSNPYLIHLALAISSKPPTGNEAHDSWFEEFQARAKHRIKISARDVSGGHGFDDRHLFRSCSSPFILESPVHLSRRSSQQETPIRPKRSSFEDQNRQHFDDMMIDSDFLDRSDESHNSFVTETPSLCLQDETLPDTPLSCPSSEDLGSDFTPIKPQFEAQKLARRPKISATTLSTLLRPDPSTPKNDHDLPSSPFDVLMSLPHAKKLSPALRQPAPVRAPPGKGLLKNNPSRRTGLKRPERERHIYHAPRTAVPTFLPPRSSSPPVPKADKSWRTHDAEDETCEDDGYSTDELF